MSDTNTQQTIVKFDINGAKLALESYRENMELLKNEYSDIPDCTTKDGYELARVRVGKLVKFRGEVDRKRKDLKADAIKYNKEVESGAQEIISAIKEIEEPIKEAKAKIDDAKKREKEEKARIEQERRESILFEIDEIRSIAVSAVGDSAEILQSKLEKLQMVDLIEDHFQEFYGTAQGAKIDTEQKLESMMLAAVQKETAEEEERIERERVAKEQSEKEEKLRKDREEFEAQKAEQEKESARLQVIENNRLAKERKEQNAKDEERARLQKIEDDKRAAEQMEIDRQKAELAEQKRKQDEKEQRDREFKEAQENAAREAKEKEERERNNKAVQDDNRKDISSAIADIVNTHTHDDSDADSISEIADKLMAGKIPHMKYTG